MARAMLAAVIGRPASESQYMIWRYSSSATVACDIQEDASRRVASPFAPHKAPARSLREGAARRPGLALRAQVGRVPHDRVPGRRRHPAPEPRREAHEPLLPG